VLKCKSIKVFSSYILYLHVIRSNFFTFRKNDFFDKSLSVKLCAVIEIQNYYYGRCVSCVCKIRLLILLSALQLFMNFGLIDDRFPLLLTFIFLFPMINFIHFYVLLYNIYPLHFGPSCRSKRYGFNTVISLASSCSFSLSECRNHAIRLDLNYLTVSFPFINLSNSSLVFIFQEPSAGLFGLIFFAEFSKT
jgi:hypothetical protein